MSTIVSPTSPDFVGIEAWSSGPPPHLMVLSGYNAFVVEDDEFDTLVTLGYIGTILQIGTAGLSTTVLPFRLPAIFATDLPPVVEGTYTDLDFTLPATLY